MSEAWIVGASSTPFRKWPDRDFRDLAQEAVTGALADAGRRDAPDLGTIYFGNCALHVWGQGNIRGQVVLRPLQDAKTLPERAPVVNVEGGCATGSAAFRGAVQDVLSGSADLALAVGVEKTLVPDDLAKTFAVFTHGIDRLHAQEWRDHVGREAAAVSEAFEPDPRRVVFLDIHALQARRHMARYGTTAAQLAAIASKNHRHGSLNPKAQLRFEVSVDKVLADKPIVAPLTRAMCAPISDGAAAVLVASRAWLDAQPAGVRERAVRVRASVLVGGSYRGMDDPDVVEAAAEAAYRHAGVGPADVDVAEVHDANAFCELHATEALGFCGPGEGGPYAESGATALGGERPVNPSGGLESKGHPLGATGLGMLDELVTQLRGEAGERQVGGQPTVALQHNAGGMIGLEEALCSVAILSRD